jgi:hypothetical protein
MNQLVRQLEPGGRTIFMKCCCRFERVSRAASEWKCVDQRPIVVREADSPRRSTGPWQSRAGARPAAMSTAMQAEQTVPCRKWRHARLPMAQRKTIGLHELGLVDRRRIT